ncbi:hypothetical protein COLO4_19405 [Corchorus olitorius]|uniref:Uncharacterized protein n=1 Tax=Corchorus olitorius TaxID=93759 RepID=A0A1R3J5G4_9ROSI|nr:hypothetical protein COLO4_19405 [Corchorus olitorius]
MANAGSLGTVLHELEYSNLGNFGGDPSLECSDYGEPSIESASNSRVLLRSLPSINLSAQFKVITFERKSSGSASPFLSIQSPNMEKRKKILQPLRAEQSKHKRKGNPKRAPFF